MPHYQITTEDGITVDVHGLHPAELPPESAEAVMAAVEAAAELLRAQARWEDDGGDGHKADSE